ncbi:zinc-dependent alcohol dehydrogenase family protein [Virgibacillus natechei]
MKGIQFPGDKEVVVKDFEKPTPGKNEVLVNVKAAGICGSDLNYLYRTAKENKDKYLLGVWVSSTVIPGHEPCGIVEEVGDNVTKFKKGDRVLVYHISGCGTCKTCREGNPMLCETKETYGFDINGVFADSMIAKENDCFILPDNISFEVGSYLACGAGTAFKASRRLNISGYDTVSIFGLGPVGLAAVAFAKKFGAKVIAVDLEKKRLDLAKKVGADYVISGKEEDPVEKIKSLTNGEGTSKGIECSSNPIARRQVLNAAKDWATVAYVGEGGNVEIDVSNQIIHKQLTLIGSWVYSLSDLMELIEFVSKEEDLPLEDLITHRFTLDEAEEAMKIADSGKCGKVVFTWK